MQFWTIVSALGSVLSGLAIAGTWYSLHRDRQRRTFDRRRQIIIDFLVLMARQVEHVRTLRVLLSSGQEVNPTVSQRITDFLTENFQAVRVNLMVEPGDKEYQSILVDIEAFFDGLEANTVVDLDDDTLLHLQSELEAKVKAYLKKMDR